MKIKLENVQKKFFSLKRGEVPVLHDISLEISDGEFFVLLGPSGCGKSTLLNMIAGLEKPTSGTILFGKDIVASPSRKTFVPPKTRNVAMVFQSYALYPHLTVFENIAFPLRIAKEREDFINTAVHKSAE
ncbi:MAG: ABC transporter ATP-binding protein, partial [Elusimicrobiota bacterium]